MSRFGTTTLRPSWARGITALEVGRPLPIDAGGAPPNVDASSSVSGKGAVTAAGRKGGLNAGSVSTKGALSASAFKAASSTSSASAHGSTTATGNGASTPAGAGVSVVSAGGAVTTRGVRGAFASAVVSGTGRAVASGRKATSASSSTSGAGALLSVVSRGASGVSTVSAGGRVVTSGALIQADHHPVPAGTIRFVSAGALRPAPRGEVTSAARAGIIAP